MIHFHVKSTKSFLMLKCAYRGHKYTDAHYGVHIIYGLLIGSCVGCVSIQHMQFHAWNYYYLFCWVEMQQPNAYKYILRMQMGGRRFICASRWFLILHIKMKKTTATTTTKRQNICTQIRLSFPPLLLCGVRRDGWCCAFIHRSNCIECGAYGNRNFVS